MSPITSSTWVSHFTNDHFTDFLIVPGMLHLPLVQAVLKEGIHVCAQNCSATAEGAFTGEISCDHLIDYRINHVMIGQNERRKLFNESQNIVNEKLKQAWDCDLSIVYCVGENSEQRESEQTDEVLDEQLRAIKTMDINWDKFVIVYEPLWAMGTSIIASADQTQESCELIRKWVYDNVN